MLRYNQKESCVMKLCDLTRKIFRLYGLLTKLNDEIQTIRKIKNYKVYSIILSALAFIKKFLSADCNLMIVNHEWFAKDFLPNCMLSSWPELSKFDDGTVLQDYQFAALFSEGSKHDHYGNFNEFKPFQNHQFGDFTHLKIRGHS